jgi:carbamate kinase
LIVLALGGNAILQRGEKGSFEQQYRNVQATMSQVADLVVDGWRVVVTHGNGPQIGATLIRHELARRSVPAFPLHACGAETQGFLGYVIQQCLQSELAQRGVERLVVSVVTQVVVDRRDPAFGTATKPIGPFYSQGEAKKLMEAGNGLVFREDSGRGYRRMVASPDPKLVVEAESIRKLVEDDVIVVACGGGGIPVVRSGPSLSGVDAVIDKDLAAERLASGIGARRLAILTDVQGVFLRYRKEGQELLSRVGVGDLSKLAGEGHFASGSMGPKVEAVVRFLRNGGGSAVIAYLGSLKDAVEGRSGTQVTP